MWPNPRVPYELASSRKKLLPPNGKPLIVHVVMNIEYWLKMHSTLFHANGAVMLR
jgi:hypothetical protein